MSETVENQTVENQTNCGCAPQESAAGKLISDIAGAIFGGTPKEQFVKGAIIGGVAAYLLTNKSAQEALFKGAMKLGASGAQFFGEIKDRFDDARAEFEAGLAQGK